jgi:hypothetical protein
MKQNLANRPLTSREYKIMLAPNEFKNIEKGIGKILRIVDSQMGNEVKSIKEIQESNRKRTWFLDTTDFNLFKNNKFIVRIRQGLRTGEVETTVKCRHPDRYISASQDLWSNKKNLELKFEEDVSIPFVSQFSQSGTFKKNKIPILNKFKDLRHFFPRINITSIDESEPLRKVNNFEPSEVTHRIGSIKFTEKKSIDLYLNLWYSQLENKNEFPLIVELTFNCEAKKLSNKNERCLEEFSISLLKQANKLYLLLQNQEIADHTTTKTKTEFAYMYKHG